MFALHWHGTNKESKTIQTKALTKIVDLDKGKALLLITISALDIQYLHVSILHFRCHNICVQYMLDVSLSTMYV